MDVALGDDDALGELHFTRGSHQLAARGTGNVAGLPHGSGNADGPGVGGAELHLTCIALRPQDGGFHLALGSHNDDLLLAGELAGLGEVFLVGQGSAFAKENRQRLFGDVDVTGRGFNNKRFGHGTFLLQNSITFIIARFPDKVKAREKRFGIFLNFFDFRHQIVTFFW